MKNVSAIDFVIFTFPNVAILLLIGLLHLVTIVVSLWALRAIRKRQNSNQRSPIRDEGWKKGLEP